MKQLLEFRKKHLSFFFLLSLFLALLTVAFIRICIHNEDFADLINFTLAHFYRRTLSLISDVFPFSLFEVALCLIPVWIILVVFLSVRAFKKGRGIRFVFSLFGVLLLFYSMYLWGLSMPYHTTTVDQKLDLETDEVTESDIYGLTLYFAQKANYYANNVELYEGETVMPYSFDRLSSILNDAYESYYAKNPTVLKHYGSRPKNVFFGSVMSDFHIVGVYSFFTGEANVSTDYPDYDTPFTVAHEMAHQRGILRENEANFIAYLVCLETDDDYIKYSAYLNMLEYFLSALSRIDAETYGEVYNTLDVKVKADFKASALVSLAHKDSLFGRLMSQFNDAYIKQNGGEGTVSYSRVVTLAAAYHKKYGQ